MTGQYKGSKCRTESSISSNTSRYIHFKLELSINSVSHIEFSFQYFFFTNDKLPKIRPVDKSRFTIGKYGLQLEITLATLNILLCIFDTHVVCLQWNESQWATSSDTKVHNYTSNSCSSWTRDVPTLRHWNFDDLHDLVYCIPSALVFVVGLNWYFVKCRHFKFIFVI